MGEFDEPDEPYRIDVIASPDNKTLQFIDNGIGMTAEEVEKYINQIAFPVLLLSLSSTRTRQQRNRSSVISDSVSTPHLWLPIR